MIESDKLKEIYHFTDEVQYSPNNSEDTCDRESSLTDLIIPEPDTSWFLM